MLRKGDLREPNPLVIWGPDISALIGMGEDGVPTHTAGTAATIATNADGYDVGVKSITMTYGTEGTGCVKVTSLPLPVMIRHT